MDILDTARRRMRNRQWESDYQQRRLREYERTVEKLEDQERLASFPDNPNRIADLERIRAEKQEVLAMIDEEFGMSEQYREIADS